MASGDTLVWRERAKSQAWPPSFRPLLHTHTHTHNIPPRAPQSATQHQQHGRPAGYQIRHAERRAQRQPPVPFAASRLAASRPNTHTPLLFFKGKSMVAERLGCGC